MAERTCQALNEKGEPCRQAPLRDGEHCFWHSPETAEEAKDARRAGGSRRKRDDTLAAVYEFEGLDSVPRIRRLFEIAGFEALALPAGKDRIRLLLQVGQASLKALEAGELAANMQTLIDVLKPRLERGKK